MKKFMSDKKAATAVEYVLVGGVVVGLVFLGFNQLGTHMFETIHNVAVLVLPH